MAQYGYFDDASQEYVITRPDTPLPWLNMLGQDEFYGLCTQTAGGYSFWKDARLRRLTRYRYNNNPMDNDGRFLYIKHGKSVWNPGWKPVRAKLDAFECRHGLGYTRIKGRKDGIEVEQLMFVPPNENLEVWKVSVRNKTKKAAEADPLLVRRVLLLRGAQRHDELPAHIFDRRGGDRGQRHLPQDRVPRAPQPLHAIRMHAADRRIRHLAGRLCRRPQRPARSQGGPGRQMHEQPRLRLEPRRGAPDKPHPQARPGGDVRLRARVCRAGGPAQIRRAVRDEQGEGPRGPRKVLRHGGG